MNFSKPLKYTTLLISIVIIVLLIYRKSEDYSFKKNITLDIWVDSKINLNEEFKDSLIHLVDLYVVKKDESLLYYQTKIVFHSDSDSSTIRAKSTILNKIRSFVNQDFYTFEEREYDVKKLYEEKNDYSEVFNTTCSKLPEKVDLNETIQTDTTKTSSSQSIQNIKAKIKKLILTKNKNNFIIAFNYQNHENEFIENKIQQTKNTIRTPNIQTKNTINQSENSNAVDNAITLKKEDSPSITTENKEKKLTIQDNSKTKLLNSECCIEGVSTVEIKFKSGNPNVFSWNNVDCLEYYFSLECTEGDAKDAIKVNRTLVKEGKYQVTVSFDQMTEKKYTATLEVYCDKQIVKTFKKKVKLQCS